MGNGGGGIGKWGRIGKWGGPWETGGEGVGRLELGVMEDWGGGTRDWGA